MSRTFIRIITLISLLLFVVLIGYSFVAFVSFEGIVTDKTYQENIKELRIIADYIKNMHETVRNFAYKQINDTSISPLFEKKSMDYAEMFSYLNELKESFVINPIFHSAIFYSGITGNYYSTLSSKAHMDTFFVDSVENYKQIQVLKPIPRKLPYEAYNNEDTVFTYIYFQTYSGERLDKVMAVNLDAAWLCDKLKNLKGKSAKAYIIDKKSGVFIDDSRKIRNAEELDTELVQKVRQPGLDGGSFTTGTNEGQCVYTYLWMPDTDWILVVEEPNTFFQQSVQIIKKVVFRITLSIALLALIAVLVISRIIYMPFGKLFKRVIGPERKTGIKSGLMDDVKEISDVFEMNQKSLIEYKYYKNSADRILLENYIKAVLVEDNSMANQLTDEFSSVYGNVLQNGIILMLLKIDKLAVFEKLDDNTRKAYRFAIVNISEELLDLGHSAKSICMGDGEFLLLTFINDLPETDKEKYLSECRGKVSFLQQKINEITGVTISAFIGGYASGTQELVRSYDMAEILSKYKVMYNREAILDASILEQHINGHRVYDENMEEKTLDAVRSGNTGQAKELFELMLVLASKGDVEDFMLSIARFSLSFGKTIDMLNRRRIGKIPVSTKDFYKRMTMFESIEDIKDWFYELMEIISENDKPVETRNDALVESIKKYIGDNYSRDLSLKMIASEFKLSQGYLGVIFKEYIGLSAMDYINNVRLDKALLLLTETELSITGIMGKTGFINESYFYKLFRKKYGVTPKTYRVNKEIIDKSGI